VKGTHPAVDGNYVLDNRICNKNSVWVLKNGEAYIQMNGPEIPDSWSFSPNFCKDSWMSSCQAHTTKNDPWQCDAHPLNPVNTNTTETHDHTFGDPWEETLWVSGWFETVSLSCIDE